MAAQQRVEHSRNNRDHTKSHAETHPTLLEYTRAHTTFIYSTSHTNSIVYNACNRNDIRFLFVPAKMTWLLQPLDVAGFAIFKLRLRQFYRREQIRARHGQVATVTWMRLLGTAIRTVMQGTNWSRTFDGCGIAPLQTGLRHRILKDIGCDEGVSVPPGEPSLAALGAVFPKRRRLHANQLLRLPREALAREDVASSPSSSPEPPPIHWFGRTRSTAAAPVVVEEADADIVAPSGSISDAAIASLPPLPAPAWTQGPMTRLRTALAKGRPLEQPPLLRRQASKRWSASSLHHTQTNATPLLRSLSAGPTSSAAPSRL